MFTILKRFLVWLKHFFITPDQPAPVVPKQIHAHVDAPKPSKGKGILSALNPKHRGKTKHSLHQAHFGTFTPLKPL